MTAENEMITTVANESTFKKRMQQLNQEDYRIIVEELNCIIDGGDVHTSSWIPGRDWRGTLYEPIWISYRQNSTEAAKFYGQILYKVMIDRPETWCFGNYTQYLFPCRMSNASHGNVSSGEEKDRTERRRRMMDETELLRRMTDEQLVRLYGLWYEEMKKRGIVRTRNIVGDVGEFYAVEAYRDNPRLPDLTISPVSMKHFDATSHEDGRYSIKTITGTSTGVFYGLNPPGDGETSERLFDYLVLVRLNKDYTLDGVYEMDWETFIELKSWHSRMQAWKIAVNKNVLMRCLRVD